MNGEELVRTVQHFSIFKRRALIQALDEVIENGQDPEVDHRIADDLLLAYVNDPEVTALFDKINKWYA